MPTMTSRHCASRGTMSYRHGKSACPAADLQYFALLHFSLDGEVKAGHLSPQPLTLPIHPFLCAPAQARKPDCCRSFTSKGRMSCSVPSCLSSCFAVISNVPMWHKSGSAQCSKHENAAHGAAMLNPGQPSHPTGLHNLPTLLCPSSSTQCCGIGVKEHQEP